MSLPRITKNKNTLQADNYLLMPNATTLDVNVQKNRKEITKKQTYIS